MPLSCLVMITPVFFTSAGRRPRAWLTRFCTSTEARSTLRETSKVTVMMLVPSLPLVEEMYFIPCTPLMDCSRGMVTADSTVCALAPIYELVTSTCGGAKSGNCATGSVGMQMAPASTMNNAQTVAKTGRSMKKSTNKVVSHSLGIFGIEAHHRIDQRPALVLAEAVAGAGF